MKLEMERDKAARHCAHDGQVLLRLSLAACASDISRLADASEAEGMTPETEVRWLGSADADGPIRGLGYHVSRCRHARSRAVRATLEIGL